MRDLALFASLFIILCTPSVGQQDPKGAKPKSNIAVDQASVDKAIDNGLKYLRTSDSPGTHVGDSDELKLLTFIEGGISENDAAVQALLKKCLDAPLEKTYKVALLAMCLEAVDRVKYQHKIAQCGQFLLDNIKPNGGFAYGEPTSRRAAGPRPSRSRSPATARGRSPR
jgi:hypothetical protein